MNTPPSDAVGGLSPDWYCSGGSKEDELEIQLRNLRSKVAHLEHIVSEKDREIEELSTNLREERKLEAESLSNMKTGSEKLLEQKKLQVQQLNSAIKKLNESLRKKDQQLSTIVAHNLRADGAYTETAAELSEAKLNLRHSEADRSKERVAIQRLEGQMTTLTAQNHRLDELVQQYRLELTRKENALNTQQRNNENQSRLRHLQSMEVVEALGEATAHLTRLENDLNEQESILLSGTGLLASCTPPVARPGQRVRVNITTTSTAAPRMSSSSNALDFSPVTLVSADAQATTYTMLFTTGSREGTAQVIFTTDMGSAQTTVVVEGSQTLFDISGSEVTMGSICYENEPMEVLITTRDTVANLVVASLRDEEIQVPESPLRRSSLASAGSALEPSAFSSGVKSARSPTVVVNGASIVQHVKRVAKHTHKLVVCPKQGKCVTVQLVDDTGPVAAACCEVKTAMPDLSRTVVEAAGVMTVGDRGTVKVKLYDAGGRPCPPPAGVPPSDLIKPSCGENGAEDATDLEGEILTFGFGEYGFHFVPLAIGKTTLNVSVGNAYKETVAVRVVEAGGAAVFDNFEVNAAPPSMCVPLESDVSLSVLFYDEDGRPAASAPEPAVLDISIEGDAFTLTGVAPDPNVPSSLVVTLLPEQGGTSNVTISCKGGSKKATFPIFCADKEHVGQYHKVGLSVCGSSVVPGGSFDVFASPVDCLGNVLPCFPDYVKDEGLTAMLEGTDVDVPLVACSGGKLKANLTAPLNEGFYIVAVGRTQVAVEVSTSTIMSSKSVAETSKVLINRLPGILYSLRAREQAFKNARAEATDAVQEWERAKALNDELERHTTEEVTKALAAANRERDTMQIKIDDLKSSLASERREEEEFQKRWDEREESLEKERAQRAEDRRLWIEERNRLTDLDEENAKVIAALRKQITDLQAKGKQQQVVMQRKITEQVEEAQKVIAAEEAKWEIDRSTYEVRCNKVAERVEELKEELEVERRRSEQGNATISQLEQRMTSLKVEAQELRHTNEKSLSEAEQVKEELVESGVQSTKKIDELERHHAQLIATSNKTHLETVTSLQNEIAVLKEQHKQALESTALEGEARKAAALAQLETEKMRIVQEKEEQALANEDLLTQIRTAHREILAAQDAKENDNRLWETEKRSLERMLEERNQTVRDAEQRCADEIGTNKALVEHNKSLWLNEKQLLTERVSSLEEEARSASEHWESKFSTEKQILSNEKASWAHERQELVISISKLKERLDDTVKHGNKVLENEKLQIDDERRQWMNERADFRARLNDLQQTQDDAVRKYTRTIEEIKSHAEEEREEWCIAKAELESELQDTKAHQTNTAADTRREMSTLKGQLEALRHEAAQQQAQHEQELKQRDEQADVEKRKAVKQLQVTREDFEVEKEKYKRETISLRQQAENLQATLEDAHSRHVMKMEETELERQKWVAEKAQLRDRLAVIEASAAELAEDHKQQLGEHDRQLAAVKKESEAVLQAKISQIEAHMATRMQQEAADMEAKHALAAEEWEAALVRAAESHKAEIARIQAAAEERENMADSYLDTAKENYKIEIDKLEAELAKAKTEKVAARQRAETERSEERQRSRQEMQQVVDEHERERKQWETSRDELLKASDEMKMAHQREVNELNRQLQRAGLDEAEAQQEESRKEMASLRVAWQKQLAAAHDAHERDRAAFAKEREEWRSERSKLWNERNSNKQLLEASLAEAMQARDDAELLATQRVEEITKLLDRNTEMEDLLQSARRKLEERASVEQQLLDSGKDEWEQEKGDLHAQMEHLRDNMEHQQNERLKLQQEIEELQRQADEAMTDSTSKHHKKVDVLRKELDLQNAAVAKLQREISKQVASNEQLQKKMAEESKQATTEAHNLQHASETGLQSAKHRIDELEQEVSTQQQKLQDANTIHVRQVNEFEEEKEQLMQEYEDLRNRHSEIQANYNTQIQKSAEEAQKLRVVSSMSDTEWAAKEQRWTESMEEANKQLQQERELSNERLVKAQAAIEEQLENSENEKTDLRAQLQSTEAALALEKQTRSETDTWHKDKLESEKQAWARDRDHTAQQLESYKKLLQETQQKQQESLEAMSSERKQWLAERVKLREEATALRTQLSGLEQSFIEQAEQYAKQLTELTQKEDTTLEDVTNAEMKFKNEELGRLIAELQATKERYETERQHRDELYDQEKERLMARLRTAEEASNTQVEVLKKSHGAQVRQLMEELAGLQDTGTHERQRFESEKVAEREKLTNEASRLSSMLNEERNKWNEERTALCTQLEAQKKSTTERLRRERENAEQQQREMQDKTDQRHALDAKREELERQLVSDMQKFDSERDSFKRERVTWHEERRTLWSERDELKAELENTLLQVRTSKSEAALSSPNQTTALHAKLEQAMKEASQKSQEAVDIRNAWAQEKKEFDSFLAELDCEKEKDRKKTIEEANKAWLGEREELRKEISRLSDLSLQLNDLQSDEKRADSTGATQSPSPSLSNKRSSGGVPSFNLDELKSALVLKYGSTAAAVSSMLAGDSIIDNSSIYEMLRVVGLEHVAPSFIQAAVEAGNDSLLEGVKRLLGTNGSKYETQVKEYEQRDELSKQLAEQSRKILENKKERGVVPISAKQVIPAMTVTKVHTSSSTVRSNRYKSFAYFGVEVTDGVRVGQNKQEYFGVKVVNVKGAAEQAGIEPGDVMKEIAGSRVSSLDEFRHVMESLPSNSPLYVVVDRDGTEVVLTVKPHVTNARPGSLSRYTQAVSVHADSDYRSRSGGSDLSTVTSSTNRTKLNSVPFR